MVLFVLKTVHRVGDDFGDDKSSVIYAAYRHIFHCNEALEAELHAIMEGVSLTIQRSNLPVQLQSDCVVALSALANESLDK